MEEEFGLAVAILSLTRMGIPCKGPVIFPAARSASKAIASAMASGFVSITACKIGLTSAIRARYAYHKVRDMR